MMEQSILSRRLGAEAFGTFCLVFAGAGAAVVNEVTGGGVTHVGVALTFGLIVMAMIYAVGNVSGCHINPAVTLGLCAAGRFDRCLLLPYIGSQCVGAFLASGTLRILFPESRTLGATIPAGSDLQSLMLEFLLTMILMFVILSVSAGGSDEKRLGGLVIGGVIGLEALFAGPISGASMNPVRSLAPAVVSMHLDHVWLYIVAPLAGALLAGPLWHFICSPPCGAPGDNGRCS
jgi:aquaporin NIP